MTTASSTDDVANFSVKPAEGSYYATTTQYMDITIDSWLTSGTYNKQWTATSTVGDFLTHATSTIYTIGDLSPSTYYQFKLDGTASTTAITGSTCNSNGSCLSDSTGNLTFTYQGGYSTHTFALEKDVTSPSAFTLSSPAGNSATSDTKPHLFWNASSDAESDLAKYQLYIDGSLDKDNISPSATSITPTTPLFCGGHTWYIRAYDNNGNYTNSDTFDLTMVCGSGLSPVAYSPPASPAPSVDNPQGGFKVLANNGANTTNKKNIFLNLYAGLDTVNMAVSEDPTFKNVSLEPYKSQIEYTLSAGDDQKTIYVKFYNKYGQATTPITTTITLAESKSSTTATAGEAIVESEINITLEQMKSDAAIVTTGDVSQLVAKTGIKRSLAAESVFYRTIVENIVKNTGASVQTRNAITNFVTYGTQTTQPLGAGERAGVINSFKAAFGSLPTTENDWNDVIKIANGRWPGQISQTAEERANINFKKVYLRTTNRKNPHDSAAITVMAYGLRPAKRNLESEKVAIKTFRAVYGYNPLAATAWDVVRAIAYSGAKR